MSQGLGRRNTHIVSVGTALCNIGWACTHVPVTAWNGRVQFWPPGARASADDCSTGVLNGEAQNSPEGTLAGLNTHQDCPMRCSA